MSLVKFGYAKVTYIHDSMGDTNLTLYHTFVGIPTWGKLWRKAVKATTSLKFTQVREGPDPIS